MTTLYANPHDMSAMGFYFDSVEEYADKVAKLRNSYGDRVEEFVIDFINGDDFDAEFGKAWELNQCNFPKFLEACDTWEEGEKVRYIIGVGECGISFDPESDQPDQIDVDIYECSNMKELAERFVDEGFFGDIPSHLVNYIDYDAIARDLEIDYSETKIDGQTLIYRCG